MFFLFFILWSIIGFVLGLILRLIFHILPVKTIIILCLIGWCLHMFGANFL